MPSTSMLHRTAAALATIPLLVACGERLPDCAADNAGLTLPDGFCALVVADSIGRARHLTVAANGDVFVAVGRSRQAEGGVVVLRDSDADGVADIQQRFGGGSGDDVEFRGEYLYYSTNDAVMRYPWRTGALEPAGEADTIVSGLPATRSHRSKSIAFGGDGALYVNIGSPSNVCTQREGERQPDPCPELETRAGIWRFDADQTGQTQGDGVRYATGLRNTVALASRPQDGGLYGVIHGRDNLGAWDMFDQQYNAENPAEEFVRIEEGDNVGWPYCYYNPQTNRKLLAPEFGGDGETQGRCADMKQPLIGFPGHWAPDGLLFYTGDQLPERYRGGAFVVFHGSWNRAPLPQAGYKVVFAPFAGDQPTGEWEVFADGFGGAEPSPRGSPHRPVAIAEGPDGSLYVSDDRGGRIYRILYRGE